MPFWLPLRLPKCHSGSEGDPTPSLPLSILKDTCLLRERLLALAIHECRGACDDDDFSGEERGSGEDSGGKVARDKLGSNE